MQSSYWGYWLVLFGVAITALMISVSGLVTDTTQNYYSVKEVVEYSMLDAVDFAYFRDYNELKIDKEKFEEVVIRRLAESMSGTDSITVNFYAIYEAPPKVTVEVISGGATELTGLDTTTRVSAILQIYATEA